MNLDPRDRAAMWRGDELLAREDWLHEPPRSVWQELEGKVSVSRPGTCGVGDSPALSSLVRDVRDGLEQGSGAVLLRGLPLGPWGEDRAARAFRALASRLGTPLSQSAEGERLFRVRDEGFGADDPRFRGPSSSKRLSFHTDRCDVIAFLCLRRAKEGGETSVVSSVALCAELGRRRPELLDVLRGPFPYLRHTVDQGNPLPYCMLPVFSKCEGRFAGHLLRVLIERADRSAESPGLTPLQREALDALDACAEEPGMHVRLALEPGDMLLLNNWVTFHRRDAFVDHEDPARRRELLRIWLSVPNSRPIDPAFRDHFGETRAGRVRGGMRPRS